MAKRRKKKIKIVEKSLKRERVWGFAYKDDNLIEIERSMVGKLRFRVILHELLHLAFPNSFESSILKAERLVGNALWDQGYRRIDNRLK